MSLDPLPTIYTGKHEAYWTPRGIMRSAMKDGVCTMQAHELGFGSSWRMLTRDKGWIKPVLVLTLVGWIPILGQIAVFGYALEWARLTAWGVDSAPKQRGVDYGKVLSTGWRAFLVTLTLGLVITLVLQIIFPGSLAVLYSSMTGLSGFAAMLNIAAGGVMSIVLWILVLLSSTFVNAAALRATLYDSFSAGWRLDRLFQMIGRDFGGFLKTYVVSLLGGLISMVYTAVVSFLGGIVVSIGVLGAVSFVGISGSYMDEGEYLIRQLLSWGAGPALLIVICAIVLAFIGAALGTAMSLVSINAVGQWFCRFDVNRWGTSAAPLPNDVPRKDAVSDPYATPPTEPPAAAAGYAAPSASAPSEPAAAPAAEPVAPVAPVAEIVEDDPIPAENVSVEDVEDVPVVEAVGEAPAQEGVADTPAEETVENTAEESAQDEAEATKKPIPLGPISSDDAPAEDDGPISV